MERHSWTLSEAALARLEVLLEHWLRYGAVMNLTGARTRQELLPHLRDGLETALCVRRVRAVDAETRWIDIGSGGGFPGLVVGAVLPCQLWLVEPRQKRAAFLELASRAIERSSIVVNRERFERSTWGEKAANGFIRPAIGEFQVASARAVFEPAKWSEMGRDVVESGGHVVLHLSDAIDPGKFGPQQIIRGDLGSVAAVAKS